MTENATDTQRVNPECMHPLVRLIIFTVDRMHQRVNMDGMVVADNTCNNIVLIGNM